ncbi:alpha/beta hydrolase [Streptomyces umbrinus]|uniref:alpha/beta hydrolase n=1 Tax=Streptomyces umbrinus TaxID=67370 RepID=UPI003439735E
MSFEFKTTFAVPPAPAPNVTVENVTFLNRDMQVAGHLYAPKERPAGKTYPAIVVGHPFLGIKEQTSGLHAALLAELGYVALAYDATHYGQSGGQPREEEVPSDRVEDFSAAIDFLTTLDCVDPERIGVVGVCASGGYSIAAAQQEARIKAVATVSMFNMGRVHRQEMGDAGELLAAVGANRTSVANGGEVEYFRPLPLPTEVDENTPPLFKTFVDYYYTPRGEHSRNTLRYTAASAGRLVNFFPLAQIETISPRPLLMIVGENAESRYYTDEAIEKAAEPKELFVVPGAGHVDLYDQPHCMAVSMQKLDDFFAKYLGS